MTTLAALAATQPAGGHPVWHSALLAAAAVVTFGAIKLREVWTQRAAREPRHAPLGRTRTPMLLLGSASAGAAALHALVCPEHFHEATSFGLFFLAAAVLQATWAVGIVAKPTSRMIGAGVIGNALVVALWLISRTSGLPVGPEVWEREAIDLTDALATVLEVAIVIGGSALLVPHRRQHAATAL